MPIQPQDLRHSPAADRNKQPLLEALRPLIGARGHALEIASGTGQHIAHFAAALPDWHWQPTEADPGALPSIRGWCQGLANVAEPRLLDLLAPAAPPTGLPAAGFELMYCANLLHISPWPTCAALMRTAAHALRPGGLLLIYGPFEVPGRPLAPSNLAFDADLKRRHPDWGLRQLDAIRAAATEQGLAWQQMIAMPANNDLLVFTQRPSAPARGQSAA